MKKLEAIKIIKKELRQGLFPNGTDKTRWCLVEKLSNEFGLQDTAYRDKIRNRQKEGLLKDYLLDLSYWKKKLTKVAQLTK